MKAEYDRRHDAAYFEFSAAGSVRQVKLDDLRIIDIGTDGTAVGVEFLSPSRGVELADVPHAAEIEIAARRLGFPIGRPASGALVRGRPTG